MSAQMAAQHRDSSAILAALLAVAGFTVLPVFGALGAIVLGSRAMKDPRPTPAVVGRVSFVAGWVALVVGTLAVSVLWWWSTA